VTKGIVLLAIYSLGLAVPFLLTSLGIERFLQFYGRFRSSMHAIEVGSGGLLIALGLLLAFGRLTILASYFSFLNRFSM
ncbi:MAG: cytochrome c biogenesis protein CcdA, partial [Acidobacteriales bacterium]|nr:cytochrome c biogenesis protein CcdA [Terriglobales bacterium]